MSRELDNKSFEDGFMFGLFIAQTLVDKIPIERIAERLLDIVNGKLTLSPSPADAIAAIEADNKKPLPEELRESVHRMLGDRAEADARNKVRAEIILKMMGYDVGSRT